LMSSQRTARAAREDKMNMFALEQASLDNRAAIRARTSGSSFTAVDRLYNEIFTKTFDTLIEYGSVDPKTGRERTLEEKRAIAASVATAGAPDATQVKVSDSVVTEEPKVFNGNEPLNLTKNILKSKKRGNSLEEIYKSLDKNGVVYDRKVVSDIYRENK